MDLRLSEAISIVWMQSGERRTRLRRGRAFTAWLRHLQRRGVVTGAGSGIGKAAVRRLAREGVRVLAVDVNPAGLAGLKGELSRP